MKDFSKSTYNFSTISVGQKLTYTGFLFFVVAGWVSILVFYLKETGLSYLSLVEYYRGNEEKFLFPKTFYALWETTHFHLFTIPVLFLILIHLFMLTRASVTWKLGALAGSLLGMALDMGSPWLIVYHHPAWAWVKIAGRVFLNAALVLLIVWPVWEMWFHSRRHPPDRVAPRHPHPS